MKRLVIVVAVLLISSRGFSLPAELVQSLETHCIDCHDSIESKGEVNLDVIFDDPEGFANDGRLLALLERTLAEDEMPPADKKQPKPEERDAMVEALDHLYAILAEKHRDEPGFVVMQRLTKQEYRNALRDLTGGVVTDAGGYLPNEGGAGEGFNNVGEAQGMNTTQVEKFLEAARLSLRHLRATPSEGLVWRPVPSEPVDEPVKARLDAVNDILTWYSDRQYGISADLGEVLEASYGSAHGPYLEAAWRFRHRENDATTLAGIASQFDPALPHIPLEKWWAILSSEDPKPPFVGWSEAWKRLPAPDQLDGESIQDLCNDIVLGRSEKAKSTAEYGPSYELSFLTREDKERVIDSAIREGIWPFRIEIGEAKELFLVVTHAGDDNRGDYALWHSGVFEFDDGRKVPWHKLSKIRGANSGKIYPWAKYTDGTGGLRADAYGTRPPGAVKIEVPEGAKFLTVKLEIDKEKTERASIQALILKEKPDRRHQSFYPGRLVFGGKRGGGDLEDPEAEDRERALRRVNLPVVRRTKAGLNAERNVFADWNRCDVEFIGGPWDHQEAEEVDPSFPYHLTTAQIRESVSAEELAELNVLKDRLASIAQVEQQQLMALSEASGWKQAREGVLPPQDIELPEIGAELIERIHSLEMTLEREASMRVVEFAEFAWRRPVSPEEAGLFSQLFAEARADGLSYDSAIKQPLLAVLASPHFLFRLPHAGPGGETRELTGFELANRLSFFLWGSIPDESLLMLASSGELKDEAVLRSEVQRMLQDPKASSLASEFAGQVFGFTGFEDFSAPDPERFPEFTPQIRRAMIEEVERFCEHLFRGEAPLTDLVAADYSFVNRSLARHYGMEELDGDGFEKAALPEGRRGLPGMGLFLTKTSEPLRTSPVVRGVWIYESILGRELPSPPANIPAISLDETDEKGRSIREQLAAHRSDAGCASCHVKVDPLGIALEAYDPIGRSRDVLLDGSRPEATATAKDGTELKGASGLASYLQGQQEQVLANLTRKTLGYALGRSVAPGDKALLDRLADELPAQDYRFPWLIEEIVVSPQFTRRESY